MSLTKQEVKPSEYIATGTKTPSKGTAKKQMLKVASQLNTSSLLWLIVKRHKLGLITAWAVMITTVQMFPFVPSLVLGLFGR